MQQRIRNPKGCRITLYLQLMCFTLKQNGKNKFQFLVTNGGRSLAAPVSIPYVGSVKSLLQQSQRHRAGIDAPASHVASL
jgi:hypothetical protein